jgi:DNA polymerase III epsilon subunit-like protein
MKYLFLDLQTTGLNYGSGYYDRWGNYKKGIVFDEACEIAIIDQNRKVLLNTLINPYKSISSTSTSIHGITNKMTTNAPRWDEVKDKFLSIIKNKKIIIYNKNFDLKILQNMFIKSYEKKIYGKIFDEPTSKKDSLGTPVGMKPSPFRQSIESQMWDKKIKKSDGLYIRDVNSTNKLHNEIEDWFFSIYTLWWGKRDKYCICCMKRYAEYFALELNKHLGYNHLRRGRNGFFQWKSLLEAANTAGFKDWKKVTYGDGILKHKEKRYVSNEDDLNKPHRALSDVLACHSVWNFIEKKGSINWKKFNIPI